MRLYECIVKFSIMYEILVESLMRGFGRHLKTDRAVNGALTNAVTHAILNEHVNPLSSLPSPNPETLHLTSRRCYAVITSGKPREIGAFEAERGASVRQTILVWISMSSRGSPIREEGGGRKCRADCLSNVTIRSADDGWRSIRHERCRMSLRESTILYDTSFVPVHHVARFKKT